ncbi:OsmC family protein [Vibrio maritimus]
MTLRVKPSSEGPILVSFDEHGGLRYGRVLSELSFAPVLDNPAETLLYSIGSCMAISLQKLALRRKIEIQSFHIQITGHKGEFLPAHFTHYDIQLSKGIHSDRELAEKLLKDAKKICTISNSVSGTFELRLQA